MRTAEIKRKTNETDIALKLSLDGTGKSDINSGCGFLDHMLTLFSRHGSFDLELSFRILLGLRGKIVKRDTIFLRQLLHFSAVVQKSQHHLIQYEIGPIHQME